VSVRFVSSSFLRADHSSEIVAVLGPQLHRVNDEERILEFDPHHLERHAVLVQSEEDRDVFFPGSGE